MKICSKCKVKKSYDEFYRDSTAKDGYNSICKLCRLKWDRERRKNDPRWVAKRKLQNHLYHIENREEISKRKKKWVESLEGKISHRMSTRKWKRKNNTKVKAHSAIERAVKKGVLVPPKHCEICKSTHRIEAHHPDYRRVLDVIWLCKHCHEKMS